MKKGKLLISTIIVLVILICCIIVGILVLQESKEEEITGTPEYRVEIEKDNHLKRVTSRNNFYIAKKCAEKFYTYYSDIYKDPLDGYWIKPESIDEEKIKTERKENLYGILDEKYLEYRGITKENLESNFPEIGSISINVQDIYYAEGEKNVTIYFVYGIKQDLTSLEKTNFCIAVKVDSPNRTFKVLPEDYVEKFYKDYGIGQEVQIDEESIENNGYNKFAYQHISDVDYINDLFAHYKQSIRFNREGSYNLLDETYKNMCFEDVNDYLSYLEYNYSKISSVNLDTYTSKNKGDYTEYIFKDRKGNYYTFKETAPFKYTVILDNYTIATEDFIEEYNSLTESKKVILNVKKFFMAIDDNNYGYAYNLLSDSFKNNKYKTKASFEGFAKKNFFDKNEIEFINYEKENGLYIYKIKVLDATENSVDEKSFNIIMKLNSGTDFEMSFGTE